MGKHEAMAIIEELALRGLFRERDLKAWRLSHNWLAMAEVFSLVRPHGHGVWGHPRYTPTRYELLQIRFPKAVFWGPSALWLLGAAAQEPEALWIAIGNKSRPPRTLDLSTVIIQTRNLEKHVLCVRGERRMLSLRVYSRERAEADVARMDFHRLLARAADRAQFAMPREASFLTSEPSCRPPWHPLAPRQEDWVATQSITRTPAPARSRSGSTTLPWPPPP